VKGLFEVTSADLAAVLAAIDRGELRTPLSHAALQSRGLGHVASAFEPYMALDTAGLRAVLSALLAERAHRRPPKLTLVWSGDDPGISHTRYTRIVLPELIERAKSHVLIAGYSFDHGGKLFGPLHAAMTRGVGCELFVDVHQLLERLDEAARRQRLDWSLLSAPVRAATDSAARGRAVIALFWRLMWPFGEPHPTVYFDPRTAEERSVVSLHAKCVVIDHALTLITSANFTGRGQNRNLEAGVEIEDEGFAASLERQWANLVESAVVVRS
jgi:hypothetical protein